MNGGFKNFAVGKVYDWRGVWDCFRLKWTRVLWFDVFMLGRVLAQFDEILFATTATVVKLLLIGHLIEFRARAALAAGFRLVRGNEDW